jgi:hypothetical protein
MIRVNILAAALYPAYRLFDAWTDAREIDTGALFQVRGVCERERVCIAFHVHTCMHIRAHVVGGDPRLECYKKVVYRFTSTQSHPNRNTHTHKCTHKTTHARACDTREQRSFDTHEQRSCDLHLTAFNQHIVTRSNLTHGCTDLEPGILATPL